MNSAKNLRSFGTHDGAFHADEVTASALLLLFDLIDEDKIIRTRDPEKHLNCEYLCDVGGIYNPKEKLFDHHQIDYQGPMSSAGMILLYLKEERVITLKEYDYFNQSLILGVDAHDNGEDPQIHGLCTYSNIISSYIPIPQDVSADIMDKGFFEAVKFSRGFLQRIFKKFHYIQECLNLVKKAMEPKAKYLIFDRSIPWLDLFFELGGESHPAEFVIMPAGSHWKLRGIPPSLDKRMQTRVPLPASWAGLLGDDLKRVCNISGAIFCHKGRFISVWETKEDAMQALEQLFLIK